MTYALRSTSVYGESLKLELYIFICFVSLLQLTPLRLPLGKVAPVMSTVHATLAIHYSGVYYNKCKWFYNFIFNGIRSF